MQNLIDIPSVVAIYNYGSLVYGTANNNSDSDIILIHSGLSDAELLLIKKQYYYIDFSFYSKEEFQNLINDHYIAALECLFLEVPPRSSFVIKSFNWNFTLDKTKLRHSLSKISSNSWVKAKKKFTIEKDYNPYVACKSAFHSIRILDFGCQIAEFGFIKDYSSCNNLFSLAISASSWDDLESKLDSEYRRISHKFKLLAPK